MTLYPELPDVMTRLWRQVALERVSWHQVTPESVMRSVTVIVDACFPKGGATHYICSTAGVPTSMVWFWQKMPEKGYGFLDKMQEKGCVLGQRMNYSMTIPESFRRYAPFVSICHLLLVIMTAVWLPWKPIAKAKVLPGPGTNFIAKFGVNQPVHWPSKSQFFGCHGCTLVAMETNSLRSLPEVSLTFSLHIHYNKWNKWAVIMFFRHHGNGCQGNPTLVFFLL